MKMDYHFAIVIRVFLWNVSSHEDKHVFYHFQASVFKLF